jgi:DNA polymerase III delta prime subunit
VVKIQSTLNVDRVSYPTPLLFYVATAHALYPFYLLVLKRGKGAIMSETATAGNMTTDNVGAENPTIEGSEQEKTFTQEEVNRLVGKARKEASNKNEKYEMYKSAYQELEQIKEANMSELEKAQDKASKLEAELKAIRQEQEVASLRREIAETSGIPAGVLRGNTREEIEAHAEELAKAFHQPSAPVVGSDGLYSNKTKGKSNADLFAEVFERNFI